MLLQIESRGKKERPEVKIGVRLRFKLSQARQLTIKEINHNRGPVIEIEHLPSCSQNSSFSSRVMKDRASDGKLDDNGAHKLQDERRDAQSQRNTGSDDAFVGGNESIELIKMTGDGSSGPCSDLKPNFSRQKSL